MGVVKQAYLDSLDADGWIPKEPSSVRGRLPSQPSQRHAKPSPIWPPAVRSTRQPSGGRGPSPAMIVIARSLVRAVASQPGALVRRHAYKTVEGEVLTPGSAFKTDGGPYVGYLTTRGKPKVRNLGITNGLKFIAHCWCPTAEWIEARHRGRIVRLFLSPLPSPGVVRGLVLAPYVIHWTYWRKGMQRALDRARASRAARKRRGRKARS
jgi:hypothetical protein